MRTFAFLTTCSFLCYASGGLLSAREEALTPESLTRFIQREEARTDREPSPGLKEPHARRSEARQKMLDAARAAQKFYQDLDQEKGYERLMEAERWRRALEALNAAFAYERELSTLRSPDDPNQDEKELYAAIAAASQANREEIEKLASEGGTLTWEQLAAARKAVLERQASTQKQCEWLKDLRQRHAIARRMDRETEPRMRKLYEERLKIQDEQIAIAKRIATAAKDADTLEVLRRRAELADAVQAWMQKEDALKAEIASEKTLANTPALLRPLVGEILSLRSTAARLRIEMLAPGTTEAEQIVLKGRAEGLDAKAGILETMRQRFVAIEPHLDDLDGLLLDPQARSLVDGFLNLKERLELATRERAEREAAIAEMQALQQAGEPGIKDLAQAFDHAADKLRNVLALQGAAAARLLAFKTEGTLDEHKALLTDRGLEFEDDMKDAPETMQEDIARVRKWWDIAQAAIKSGAEKAQAGDAEASQNEFRRALKAESLAGRMTRMLTFLLGWERICKERQEKEVQSALANYRVATSAAIQAFIRASGLTDEALTPVEFEKAQDQAIAAQVNVAETRRRLTKLFAPPPLPAGPPIPPPQDPANRF